MFLQAKKLKDNRLEPIQLKYSPKEPRQHTPECLSRIGMFNSTQFQRKQSIEKRKLSSQAEGKRPQSSVQRIPRTAFLKNTFAIQYVVMMTIKKGSSFAKMEIMVLWLEESYKEEVGLQNNRQVLMQTLYGNNPIRDLIILLLHKRKYALIIQNIIMKFQIKINYTITSKCIAKELIKIWMILYLQHSQQIWIQ